MGCVNLVGESHCRWKSKGWFESSLRTFGHNTILRTDKVMMKLWLTVCGVVVLSALCYAQPPLEWTPETYPNPRTNPARCGRPYVNSSWVCDPNGLITVKEAEVLDYIIGGMVNTDTPCPCSAFECSRNRKGYYVAIALMNKIKRHPDEPNTEENVMNAALKFAYDLENNHWAYGTCKQSVIILFSKEDNMLYTVTGGTARLALTDPLVSTITANAWQHFQPGEDLSVGLKNMVINFKKVFRNEYYQLSHFVDYTAIGGSVSVHSSNLVYFLGSLIGTVLATWLLHG